MTEHQCEAIANLYQARLDLDDALAVLGLISLAANMAGATSR